jgi:Caspase domain
MACMNHHVAQRIQGFLRLGRYLLAAFILLGISQVHAAQRALLVGVSELVNQPQSLWLQAPRNDVILMRDTLLGQGFRPDDITILADGVAGAALPDAARIHEAFIRLLKSSQSGDSVVLYFSGHGTRISGLAKEYQEPDGLAENFLARDVSGSVTGSSTVLHGGVKDVEFGNWIKALLAKNVSVWSVFDTCSAASMTRSAASAPVAYAEDIRFRGVNFSQLALIKSGKLIQNALLVPDGLSASKEPNTKAQYIAFFASESHQITPELRLPRQQKDARHHGLLTWAVAQSFQNKPETWRELYQGILNIYPPVIDELQRLFPTRELPSPVAEGDLDFKIFSSKKTSNNVLPNWPAQRTGAHLTLKSGWLDGIELDQKVNVIALQSDGTALAAQARISAADASSARLLVPALLSNLKSVANWSVGPANAPPSISLRVRAANLVSSDQAVGYPASIKQVTDSAFDVQVTKSSGGEFSLQAMPELASSLQANQILFADVNAVQDRLKDLAQWKWLSHVANLAKGMEIEGFSASLEITDAGKSTRTELAQGINSARSISTTGSANLLVKNTSGQSFDLLIAIQDSSGQLHTVYPESANESNRFERGTKQSPASKRFALPVNKISTAARLIVVAGLAQPLSQPRLFGINLQESSDQIRVRGRLNTDKDRQVFASIVSWGDEPRLKK